MWLGEFADKNTANNVVYLYVLFLYVAQVCFIIWMVLKVKILVWEQNDPLKTWFLALMHIYVLKTLKAAIVGNYLSHHTGESENSHAWLHRLS